MYWIAISAPSTQHQAPSSTTGVTTQNPSASTSGESVRSVSYRTNLSNKACGSLAVNTVSLRPIPWPSYWPLSFCLSIFFRKIVRHFQLSLDLGCVSAVLFLCLTALVSTNVLAYSCGDCLLNRYFHLGIFLLWVPTVLVYIRIPG